MQPASTDLTQKHCVPCEGGIKPFTKAAAAPYLNALPKWALDDTEKKIKRTFSTNDFILAAKIDTLV